MSNKNEPQTSLLGEAVGLVRDLAMAAVFGVVASVLTLAFDQVRELDLEALGLTELDGWLDRYYPVENEE